MINLYMSHNNSYTSSIHHMSIPRHCGCFSTICTFVDLGYPCIRLLFPKSSRMCSLESVSVDTQHIHILPSMSTLFTRY
jgi:hypothetical protein